jgi:digeranylgeranylglycerophospholipid reductase
VGIGITGRKSGPGKRAKDYLDTFVERQFPDGRTIEHIVGGVSVCRPLPCTVGDGLMIVGDAARVVDPLTGGGIYNAMYTGKLAAEVAADAIGEGDTSRERLMSYDTTWRNAKLGKNLERNYKIKEFFIGLSDAKLNALTQSVAKINLKEFSTFTFVKELIQRNPRMLLELKALKDAIS